MNYKILITIFVVTFFLGCGSGGSDVESANQPINYLTGDMVEITTPQEAKKAVSTVNSINALSNSGSSTQSYAAPSRKSPSLAPVNNVEKCIDGGTLSVKGDVARNGVDLKTTYKECVKDSMRISGTTLTKGTFGSSEINLSVKMLNMEFKGSSSEITMQATMDMLLNQEQNLIDVSMDGKVTYSNVIDSGKAGYKNFRVVAQDGHLNMSGKVSMESENYACSNGVYEISTIEELYPYGDGFSDGIMVINGSTFEFNDDGTVTVTFANGYSSVVEQGSDLVCH